MPRQVEKKAFLFYASTLDILKELPEERQGKVAMAIIEYGLDDNNYFAEYSDALSALEPLERIIFRSVLYEINVQKRRYYNKYLIHGAIVTIQNIIGISENLDDKVKNTYIDIIKVLEERYQYVIKHDERNMPGELSILLPNHIYKSFHNLYKVKSWRDDIEKMFEERLKNESINLPDNIKKEILEELMADYLESGIFLERYEELLEQYSEYI